MKYEVKVKALPNQSSSQELFVEVTVFLSTNSNSYDLNRALLSPELEFFNHLLVPYWGNYDTLKNMRYATKCFSFFNCTWADAKKQVLDAVYQEMLPVQQVYRKNIAPFASCSFEGFFNESIVFL